MLASWSKPASSSEPIGSKSRRKVLSVWRKRRGVGKVRYPSNCRYAFRGILREQPALALLRLNFRSRLCQDSKGMSHGEAPLGKPKERLGGHRHAGERE